MQWFGKDRHSSVLTYAYPIPRFSRSYSQGLYNVIVKIQGLARVKLKLKSVLAAHEPLYQGSKLATSLNIWPFLLQKNILIVLQQVLVVKHRVRPSENPSWNISRTSNFGTVVTVTLCLTALYLLQSDSIWSEVGVVLPMSTPLCPSAPLSPSHVKILPSCRW